MVTNQRGPKSSGLTDPMKMEETRREGEEREREATAEVIKIDDENEINGAMMIKR